LIIAITFYLQVQAMINIGLALTLLLGTCAVTLKTGTSAREQTSLVLFFSPF